MILHKEKELFDDLLETTAQELNLPVIYVEKDYWVTYILKLLSKSKYIDTAIFKGGTSLSKAYKIIDRFSEDIDLAVITKDLGSNQIKTLIKNIEKSIIDENLQELKTNPQTSKGSQFRKTVYQYPKSFNGDFGHGNENILLELNSFSKPYPYSLQTIATYIYDFLLAKDESIIFKYELTPFQINVLDTKRTFCEKISAIARASYNDDKDNSNLKAKIRHFYDIYFLYQNQDIQNFITSNDFITMMKDVRSDDNIQFNDTWSNIKYSQIPIFNNPDILLKIENYYQNDFKDLVYAKTLPDIKAIIKTIETLSNHLMEI